MAPEGPSTDCERPRSRRGFNGAGARWRRKGAATQEESNAQEAPSTGPALDGAGRRSVPDARVVGLGELQRGRRSMAPEGPYGGVDLGFGPSFNGAGARWRRKERECEEGRRADRQLQRGRRSMAPEGPSIAVLVAESQEASTGPALDGAGRQPHGHRHPALHQRASTGPALDGAGRATRRPPQLRQQDPASTGPALDGAGRLNGAIEARRKDMGASTGPALDGAGRCS